MFYADASNITEQTSEYIQVMESNKKEEFSSMSIIKKDSTMDSV